MDRSRRLVLVDSEVSAFGRHEGHDGLDCAAAVAAKLLMRQQRLAQRIDLIAVGAARMANTDGFGNGLPQLIGERIGLTGIAGIELHAFCASGNAAVHQAATTIAAGTADVALVVGVEHLLAGADMRGPLAPEATPVEAEAGFSPPVFYGLCADRYMAETGAPESALAQVAVNNRHHGVANDKARFRHEVTVAEVMTSRMIASPLTLLQCCPQADGAGALLLAAADSLDESSAEVCVDLLGWGSASSNLSTFSLTSFDVDVRASQLAYERSGIGPEEITVAEIHDAFTISQVIHLEDVGLAHRGEGWRLAQEPAPRVVVNPSGGLLARGHPLGATGLAQFDALRRYLTRSRNASSQPRFGLIQEAGGLRTLGQILSECSVLAPHGYVGA